MNKPPPVKAGWICVALSLFLAPVAIVALILGAIVANRGETGQGVAIMVSAVISATIAIVLVYGA